MDQLDLELIRSSSQVVCIVGESGMGKTTRARRLFNELKQKPEFNVCAWIKVNHNFRMRSFLELLAKKLLPELNLDKPDIRNDEIIAEIFDAFKKKNFLLVLDDVTSAKVWDDVKQALPEPVRKGHKVIITSSYAGLTPPGADVYNISRMTQPQIIELIEEAGYQPGSEQLGEAIFHASGGSPLLATILGESVKSERATKSEQQLANELNSYPSPTRGSKALAACYNWLTPEVKACLRYLSRFPDQEIEVEDLYLLLAAEVRTQISLQSIVGHLEGLARRKLVEVREDIGSSRRGNNKSYVLQLQVANFCKSKAFEEDSFEIVDMADSQLVGADALRLTIYLSKKKGGQSIKFESEKKLESLFIFDANDGKSEWPEEINHLKSFINLSVLKFDGVNFQRGNVPRGMDKLVLLRYLSFRGCRVQDLPSSISKLTKLETLDLVVQADCVMRIPNNIFANMTKMKHLYFPILYCSTNRNEKLQLQSMVELKILVNFNLEVCDVAALSWFDHINIISAITNGEPSDLVAIANFIRRQGDRLEHSSVDIKSFNHYTEGSNSALQELLHCIHSIHIKGEIELQKLKANEGNQPETLEDMVLDGSNIHDGNLMMQYLGKFKNLTSLVLTNDAFAGRDLVIAAGDLFPNLIRILMLHNLERVQTLTIEGAMPKLFALQIRSSNRLQEMSIPKELDDKLKKAQRDDRGATATYSIVPPPIKFRTTT